MPTAKVVVTVFVAVLITEIVPSIRLVMYTSVRAGFTATPEGSLPTVTVVTMVFVDGSRTETLSLP